MDAGADLKKAVGAKRAVFGTRVTLRALKSGKVARVFLAANCPPSVAQQIKSAAEMAAIDISELDADSADLGAMCGKPFSVAVVGISK